MRYAISKFTSEWRYLFIFIFSVVSAYLSILIILDSNSSRGITSFTGKTELIAVTVSATESQYQWSLTGAYICYDPQWPFPDAGKFTASANDRLCAGPHGKSNRKHFSLPNDVSLSVVEDTTIEVAISDAPYRVDASAFPQGTAPTNILIIKKAAALYEEGCDQKRDGNPILVGGNGMIVELPDEVEIHIPIGERTLMPFLGKINLGQPNSANTSNQLQSGVVAVYRTVRDILWRQNDLQLVRETNLFPGDVLKFEDSNGCLVEASGFLKARKDDQGGYVEVVASMQSESGSAVVERATPGSGGNPGRINIELQLVDAVFSHPFTVWLGLLVTVFILLKEGTEFLHLKHPSREVNEYVQVPSHIEFNTPYNWSNSKINTTYDQKPYKIETDG